MSGRAYHNRLDRLARGLDTRLPPFHPWGKSREEIVAEILEAMSPEATVEAALRLARDENTYALGIIPDLDLMKLTGRERDAHIVCVAGVFGWEHVPEEWLTFEHVGIHEERIQAMFERILADGGLDVEAEREVSKQECYAEELEMFRERYQQEVSSNNER